MRRKIKAILLTVLTVCMAFCLKGPSLRAEEAEAGTIHTLEDQTSFSGRAEPGEVISCIVYAYPNGRDQIILYQSRMRAGDSGLFSFHAPLPLVGTQYVRLEMGDEQTVTRVIRYPRSLVSEITGYQLNIYGFLIENGRIRPGGTP